MQSKSNCHENPITPPPTLTWLPLSSNYPSPGTTHPLQLPLPSNYPFPPTTPPPWFPLLPDYPSPLTAPLLQLPLPPVYPSSSNNLSPPNYPYPQLPLDLVKTVTSTGFNNIYEDIRMTLLIWVNWNFMLTPKLMNKQCCFSISRPSCCQRTMSRKSWNLSLSVILFSSL